MDAGNLKELKDNLQGLLKNLDKNIGSLYKLATHDEKTGLYNSKFFENLLDMEFEKAKRKQQKLSLMITDIDFFKRINDRYGHIQADKLLAQLARVIKNQIRKSDIAARFGGEEFVILLPETSLPKAKRLASRLRNAIHKDAVLKKHGVTVSGGTTEFRKGDSKVAFKKRADKALYKAKNSGRDRFEFN